MPLIKSAKKQMKVSRKNRVRNFQTRDKLKNAIKAVGEAVKTGENKAAEASLHVAYKVIDTAAKKNIIHKNNAGRKKSGLAKMVAEMGSKVKAAPKAAKKAPTKAKAAPKKEVAGKKEDEKAE